MKPEDRPAIPCAHDICNRPAILRQKLPTGWANLCEFHYKYHADEEGHAFARKMGFKTGKDSRRWALSMLGGIGRALPRNSIVERWQGILADTKAVPIARSMAQAALNNLNAKQIERQPGQDDEEIPIAHRA